MRSARVEEVAAIENNAPGVEVPMPNRAALERYKGGLRPPPPPPVASVPQENTPVTLDLTSQLAALRAETVRLVEDAVPLTDKVAPGAVFKIPIRELVVSKDRNGTAVVEVAKEKALRACGIVVVADF